MKVKIGNGQEIFSVVLAGDICPGGICEKSFTQDYAGVTASVKSFVESGDLRLVQWETPVTEHLAPIIKCGPNLNSEEASIETITAAGFNIAMLANNHTGDHGPAAAMETIEKLHKHGLKTVGAGKDLISARTPLMENVKGKTVAVFNFAENEFGGAKAGKAGSAPQDPLRDVAEVRAAASKYDFVIVTLHGGHEHNPFPSPRMVQYCRAFADAGAKLVFNCHTHCPEAYENWNGTPIIYSPGNFYFPTNLNLSRLWWFGYLIRCSFGENGAVELELLPYTFDKEKVKVLDADGAAKFEAYMKKLCAPLNDPARLQQYLEAWSTVHGKAHYNLLNVALPPGTDWLAELSEPVIMNRAMRVRNIFTCEAHNDMVKCWLRLVEEQRLDEAAKLYGEIEELQKGFMD